MYIFFIKFITLKMVYKYNLFFYANACHVCKHFGKGVTLKRCGNCTMISYCSKEHQKQHWPQHKDLCAAICKVVKANKASGFFNEEGNCNHERWVQMKMNFMLLVGINIGRKLEHYEEEMFKFIRACAVCHSRDKRILKDCHNCPNTSFCMKHEDDIAHKEICSSFKLCFTLDKTLTTYEPKIPNIKIPHWTRQTSVPNSMKDFIESYIESQKPLQLSKQEELAINAEYLTRPLTLLYAIQTLKFISESNCMVIHIIAANMMEFNGIELWEILLHWLPNVSTVKIILVGPELSQGSISINLCDDCLLRHKELLIETYSTLYDNYVNTTSFLQPHLVIGYNAGIHECEDLKSENNTWVQSLYAIRKQNCPFILTSYTQAETEKEQIRLKLILGENIRCLRCTQNPYSGLRPYRDFETERIYYQNQYIIIYKHLHAL